MEKQKAELKALIDKIDNPLHLQLLWDLANVRNFDANYEGLTVAKALKKMYRHEQIERLKIPGLD